MAKGLTVGASRYARRLFEFSHFFFFSSRRRHTRSKRDWSSDVCSSDLQLNESLVIYHVSDKYDANTMDHATDPAYIRKLHRSEERRVGKECRSRWPREPRKKKK